MVAERKPGKIHLQWNYKVRAERSSLDYGNSYSPHLGFVFSDEVRTPRSGAQSSYLQFAWNKGSLSVLPYLHQGEKLEGTLGSLVEQAGFACRSHSKWLRVPRRDAGQCSKKWRPHLWGIICVPYV